MQYETFRGTLISWPKLFEQAAAFARRLRPEQIAVISHSGDYGEGIVTIWYTGELRADVDTPIHFRTFRSVWTSWRSLFDQARDFADRVGSRLLGISQSADHADGIVTVWYWGDPVD